MAGSAYYNSIRSPTFQSSLRRYCLQQLKMSTNNPAHEFKATCQLLLKRIPKRTSDQVGATFAFPEFDPNVSFETQLKELESTLEAFLSSRREFLKGSSKDRKERFKSIISGWYRSSYPFAVTILTLAKEGSAVLPPRHPH